MPNRSAQRDALFDTLKRMLRARSITYRDLGERIGLSESGVKKMFAARDCSIDRLLEVADALELTLDEILLTAQTPEAVYVVLGIEDQRWLLDNPVAFAWYWWLTTLRCNPREVRELYGRTREEMQRALTALEERGLLDVGLDDRVTLPGRGYIRWAEHGPLLDELHRRWGGALLEEAISSGSQLLRLQQIDLTPYVLN